MIYYEKRRPEKGTAKFYEMWWEPAVLNGRNIWRLWTRRGKIGTNGRLMLEEFETFDDFSKRYKELNDLRLNHGYEVREEPTVEQLSFENFRTLCTHQLHTDLVTSQ